MKSAVQLARRLVLNTGTSIPILGLGTWQSAPSEIGTVIQHAVDSGYRHFDCAAMYKNEAEIGQALDKCIVSGLCKREDLFITSKLAPDDMFSDKIKGAVAKTLNELRLDYLDLYLIHWPHRTTLNANKTTQVEPYDANWMGEVWAILESILKTGEIRAVGVSNFSIKKIETILKTSRLKPAVNQVENHIYLQQPIMKQYLDAKQIVMQAYSPLGSPQRKSATTEDPIVLADPVVKRIADTHNSTPAQVCLAFLMRDNRVVLAKSANTKRLRENFDSLQLQLTEQDITDLISVDKKCRLFRARFLSPYSTYPNFWDEDFEYSYPTQ